MSPNTKQNTGVQTSGGGAAHRKAGGASKVKDSRPEKTVLSPVQKKGSNLAKRLSQDTGKEISQRGTGKNE